MSVDETYKLLRSLKPGIIRLELKRKTNHSKSCDTLADLELENYRNSLTKTGSTASVEQHSLNSLMSPAIPINGYYLVLFFPFIKKKFLARI